MSRRLPLMLLMVTKSILTCILGKTPKFLWGAKVYDSRWWYLTRSYLSRQNLVKKFPYTEAQLIEVCSNYVRWIKDDLFRVIGSNGFSFIRILMSDLLISNDFLSIETLHMLLGDYNFFIVHWLLFLAFYHSFFFVCILLLMMANKWRGPPCN